MAEGNTYFRYDPKTKQYTQFVLTHQQTEDLDLGNLPIYSDDLQVCISSNPHQAVQVGAVGNHNTVPVAAYKLVADSIKNALDQRCSFIRHRPNSSNYIYRHISMPEWAYVQDRDGDTRADAVVSNIEADLRPLKKIINDIIGENTWMIYKLTFYWDKVLIEEEMDYRVKDWNDKIESGQWEPSFSQLTYVSSGII